MGVREERRKQRLFEENFPNLMETLIYSQEVQQTPIKVNSRDLQLDTLQSDCWKPKWRDNLKAGEKYSA